jgi:hypothetical protein
MRILFLFPLFLVSLYTCAQESEQQIAFDSCKKSFTEVMSAFEDCVVHENVDQAQVCFDNFMAFMKYALLKYPTHKDGVFKQSYEYAVFTMAHQLRTAQDGDTYFQDVHRYTEKHQFLAHIESMCFSVLELQE